MKNKYRIILSVLVLSFSLFLAGCSFVDFIGPFDDPQDPSHEGTGELVDLSSVKHYSRCSDYTYNGKEKRLEIDIRSADGSVVTTIPVSGEHPELDVRYENNINAGEAKVYISAKPDSKRFTGTKIISFNIKRAHIEVSSFAKMQACLSDPSYERIIVTEDMEWPEKVTVPSGAHLDLDGHTIKATDVHIEGVLRFGDGTRRMTFTVSGVLGNHGIIYPADLSEAYIDTMDNFGELSLKGKRTTFYFSRTAIAEPIDIGDGGYYYRRYEVWDLEPVLEYESVGYDGSEKAPTISFLYQNDTVKEGDYTLTYKNNIEPGTATVIIEAPENSKTLFGTHELSFEITPVTLEATTLDEVIEGLSDSVHYTDVVAKDVNFNKSFTVPAGRKLTFSYTSIPLVRLKHITVNGELVINSALTLYIDDGLSGTGTVINSGKVYFFGTLESATIVNKGTMNDIGGELASTLTVENKNLILVDEEPLANVINADGATLKIRRAVTADDIVVTLSEFIYNGEAHSPEYHFTDSSVKSYHYTSEVYNINDPDTPLKGKITDAGTYRIVISFSKYSSQSLTGSVSVEYKILPAEITVYNGTDLEGYLKNPNYNKVVLASSLRITRAYTVPYETELIISEDCTVSFDQSYGRYGRLIVNGTLTNNGTIMNCYTDLLAEYDTGIVRTDDYRGTFINNGIVYTNGKMNNLAVTDNGTIYERVNIANATAPDFISTGYVYSLDENGEPVRHRPTVVLYMNGEEIPSDEYVLQYHGDSYATSVGAFTSYVHITVPYDSTRFVGTKNINYTISPGRTEVGTPEELLAAVNSINGLICNWGEIVLTNDIVLKNETDAAMYFVINEATTLDLNGYGLRIPADFGDASSTHGFIFNNYGTVIMRDSRSAPESFRFPDKCEGKIIGYASTVGGLGNLSVICHEIYLTSDIIADTSSTTVQIIPSGKIETLYIDTCGYNIEPRLSIHRTANIEIFSSGKRSGTGSVTVWDSGDWDINVSLKNLSIYSIDDKSEKAILTDCIIEN